MMWLELGWGMGFGFEGRCEAGSGLASEWEGIG